MDPGTASLSGSLYGEVGGNTPFSQYRQSDEAAHNSTISPCNSITEDDDHDIDKPGNKRRNL